MKYFMPSLANILGTLFGLLSAYGVSKIDGTYAVHWATAYQFSLIEISVLIGAAVAIVFSFIVTHIAEKIL